MTEPILRYFAYTKKSIKGPFYPKDIAQLPGFSRNTLICTENALGQWKEAYLERAFDAFLGSGQGPEPQKPRFTLTHASAEDTAVRSLLEKAILKNSQLESEVKSMKRDYAHEKKTFEEELKKKDQEIKALGERFKRTAAAQAAQSEHPSWEQLYKTLKKRGDEKLFEAMQELSEKKEEILKLRSQMQNMVDNYEDSKRRSQEAARAEMAAINAQLNELRSDAEEKEMAIKTLNDSIRSVLSKNEELQSIMFDERKDHDEQNKKFCDEIGKLTGEVKWKQQELDHLKADLFEAFNKIKDFESLEGLKTKEDEELYGVVHAKVRILSGYFESLESRLKYAFRKVPESGI